MEINTSSALYAINTGGVTPPSVETQRQQLRQAAEGFEALFIGTLMKTARESAFSDELTGGAGVKSVQSMFDTQISEMSSARAGLGIADALERQFAGFVGRNG